jgi:hypothetical protein
MSWFAFNKMQANPDKFQAIAIGKKKPLTERSIQS